MKAKPQGPQDRQACIDQLFGAFERADLDAALSHAQALTEQWPDFAFGWKAKGVVHLERHDYAAALLPLERARHLTPQDVEVLNSVGNAYAHRGDAELAEQAYRAAMALDPQFFDPAKNLANLLVQAKDWPRVDAHFTFMLEHWPKSVEVGSGYALALLKQRRFAKALRYASLVLQMTGGDGDGSQAAMDALRVYAYSCESLGDRDEAKKAYERLTNVASEAIEGWLGLVRVTVAVGDVSQALSHLEQALKLGCAPARAQMVLGEVLLKSGKTVEATRALKESVALDGHDPVVWCLLGRAYLEQDALPDAAECFTRASVLQPDDATIWNNLGVVYLRTRSVYEALAAFERAIEANPKYAMAHANLAKTLIELERAKEAKAAIARSLEIDPNDAGSHLTLAKILYQSGEIAEAQDACNEALRIDPDSTSALNYMAHMAHDNGHNALALRLIERALKVNPKDASLHMNKGNVYRTIGQFRPSLEAYIKGLKLDPNDANAHSNMLFAMNYVGEVSPQTALDQAKRYGQLVARQVTGKFTHWASRGEGARLRVGFVSGDLHQHPVGYFVEALLAHLDLERFELYAYATVSGEDALTARIKPRFAHWRLLTGLSREQSARTIHGDAIHVLVDLAGHTGNTGLPIFAFKPAPVQVAYLGYFATTGVAEMDYILGDRYVTPLAEADHFSETIWQLPNSYWCYTPPAKEIPVKPLPALSRGAITFGCFNNTSKINPKVLDLWARILLDLPDARLVLKARQLNDEHLRGALVGEFVARGVDAARIECQRWSSLEDYMAAYGDVDVALDPFPFPGGTTSMDGLWMGVPVISMRGDRLVGHNAQTIAHNLGLDDWVCADADAYHAKALEWASQPDKLASLRAGMRERMRASPLIDGQQFAVHVGEALEAMYGRWAMTAGTP